MRGAVVALALLLGGCAHVKPIVVYTCMGCQALLASGVCAMVKPDLGSVSVPKCGPGEILVIENWKEVSREGAVPVLGCDEP